MNNNKVDPSLIFMLLALALLLTVVAAFAGTANAQGLEDGHCSTPRAVNELMLEVECNWVDFDGDDHFIIFTDEDNVSQRLEGQYSTFCDLCGNRTDTVTVQFPYGSYSWQVFNDQYDEGPDWPKNAGEFFLEGLPPTTTTTTVPETTTTTEPGTTTTSVPETTTTTKPVTTTTKVVTTSSSVVTSTTTTGNTPPTLPNTGPFSEIAYLLPAGIALLVAGWAILRTKDNPPPAI